MRNLRRVATLVFILIALSILAACDKSPREARRETLREVLENQVGQWHGTATVRYADGSSETLPASYQLEATRPPEYQGKLQLGQHTISLQFAPDENNNWRADVGNIHALSGDVPVKSDGEEQKLDERAVYWAGPAGGVHMVFQGDVNMDLAIDGNLPLGSSADPPPVWTSARLRHDGFRVTIGPFEIILMECVGIFATLFFASRFIIQWIASERAKRSVVPEVFWWVSLIGSGLMLIYAIYFGRFAVLIGQVTGWTVYCRNIWLIEREKREKARQEQQSEQTSA